MDSGFIDVERYIEESLVRSLRALFVADPDYTVDPTSIKNSKVSITSSKPRDVDLTKPGIYISGISYAIGDPSLNRGFKNDIMGESGNAIGEQRVFEVRFSASIAISSINNSVSKNLSNRLIDWMWIRGKDFIEDHLKIKISGMRKSQGGKIRLSDNDELFSENIQIDGLALILTTITSLDLTAILETIDLNLDLE